ncbi:MAG: C45 family autoproteolytic acyltransferase/hydrolase [Planctomycetota bacterium]|nr:C45 family autoproteolytic acyltransferase/hydrolase [Planctomycetota bacterium]
MHRLLLTALTLAAIIGCAPRTHTPSTPSTPGTHNQPSATAPSAAAYQFRDGWHILELKGSPDTIGYQHGLTLAPQIDTFIKAVKLDMSHDLPPEHQWEFFKQAAIRICWPRTPEALRHEITSIAAGLQKAGYSYTWEDILTLNAHIELPGYWYPVAMKKLSGIDQPSRAHEACSAFIATGDMTTDRSIIMGHNFWWGYLTGQYFNVMLSVKPDQGNAFIMQTAPGLIHSGTDVAVSAAGLMLCETTISGFVGFDENGIPEFVRMREAIQFSNSIDDMIAIFKKGNNGGYANTWLIGDRKTGEIAKLELGLQNAIVSRTTSGAYFGANFAESDAIKAECPGMSFRHWPRRDRWQQLMDEYKGRIDQSAAQSFLGDTTNPKTGAKGATGSTLCGRSDLDPSRNFHPGGGVSNCIVTSASARQNTLLAKWGFGDDSHFSANGFFEGRGKPHAWMREALHDIAPQPWTTIP